MQVRPSFGEQVWLRPLLLEGERQKAGARKRVSELVPPARAGRTRCAAQRARTGGFCRSQCCVRSWRGNRCHSLTTMPAPPSGAAAATGRPATGRAPGGASRLTTRSLLLEMTFERIRCSLRGLPAGGSGSASGGAAGLLSLPITLGPSPARRSPARRGTTRWCPSPRPTFYFFLTRVLLTSPDLQPEGVRV
ncbi:hypothetical protein T492DRAFT_432597 [Pavlovales sp. CCMP2436]|nr:hypothetical protein T492DRAFT_432597 [Pavlovales sp. CCMP2436]